ncbi:MAG: hypothetical protein HKN43_14275 [Rhodothermales bacterium]|nr:hypothetical protein [Rhodothermales bacterium]
MSYAMNALVHTGEQQVFELMMPGRHIRNQGVWSTTSGIQIDRELREEKKECIWYKTRYNLGFIGEDDYQWTRLLRFENYFDISKLKMQAADISDGVKKDVQ